MKLIWLFFIISNFILESNFCPLFVFNITKKDENFKDLLDALTEFEVNVDDKKGDKVRIYCEAIN